MVMPVLNELFSNILKDDSKVSGHAVSGVRKFLDTFRSLWRQLFIKNCLNLGEKN